MDFVHQYMRDTLEVFDNGHVPGDPKDRLRQLKGPWFQTQLSICLFVFFFSFIYFCIFRTRYKTLYAPRTLLRGFSPHEVHDRVSFFGWILPTLRTSEYTVLQIVGLDAAVLLKFFKMSFYFFMISSVLAGTILIPINYRQNGSSEGVPPNQPDDDDDDDSFAARHGAQHGTSLYLTSHLIFTYIFCSIAFVLLYRTYSSFIHTRQLFSLELAHSVPARTVLISKLPPHLRSERALAEYWENIGNGGGGVGMGVEGVSVGRDVDVVRDLLEKRTKALRKLELEWTKYAGNPVKVDTNGDGGRNGKGKSSKGTAEGYDRQKEVKQILNPGMEAAEGQGRNGQHDGETNGNADPQRGDIESVLVQDGGRDGLDTVVEGGEDEESRLLPPPPKTFTINGKKRPTTRLGLWGKKVDKLDYLAEQFREADNQVRVLRKRRFKPTDVAFVTFETLGGAQVAAQIVHYPQPGMLETVLAPEPRDIHWGNMALSRVSTFVRQVIVFFAVILLLFFWGIPVSFLASLLSYDAIKEAFPPLAELIDKNPRLKAFVQTSLPSLALVGFNALLPYLLEALCIFQGLRARSWIEYSLLKKYFIFLIINVLFIFVAASTLSLLQDLADQPMRILDKLATTLPGARSFFVAYVMLQGIAIMPLQLVQLGTIIPRGFYRLFLTSTPRDHAELNAPPTLNLGTVYPQAILIFIVCVTYSIIAPLILFFGALYFGVAYLVYKYQLLFVYYKPYESRGQAWPLTFNRIVVGLLIFQLFMAGLLLVRQAWFLSVLVAPLVLATLFFWWKCNILFGPLARYVNLSQASEVLKGTTEDVRKLRRGHPVTRSQSNLNRGRYGANDDSLYVVGKDEKTDYSQPPMSDSFVGVLNSGRRRYGHPALSGQLPTPWLPAPKEVDTSQTLGMTSGDAVVLNLRRRWSDVKGVGRKLAGVGKGKSSLSYDEEVTRAWRGDDNGGGSGASTITVENGPSEESLGVIALSDDEEAEAESIYRTYYHHPERRRSGVVPGAFSPIGDVGDSDDADNDGEGSNALG